MKYIRTAIAEQETTINVLYDEQIIKIYSSRVDVIKLLTKQLGEPTIKYKKSKSYWSGASWDIEFNDLKKIEKILIFKVFVDNGIEIKEKKKKTISKKVMKKEKIKSQNTDSKIKKTSGGKKVDKKLTVKKEKKIDTKKTNTKISKSETSKKETKINSNSKKSSVLKNKKVNDIKKENVKSKTIRKTEKKVKKENTKNIKISKKKSKEIEFEQFSFI